MSETGSSKFEASDPLPVGIRVASTLCWVVGIATLLLGLAVGIPAMSDPSGTPIPLLQTTLLALVVFGAAILIRQRRRLGVLILVLAWATPIGLAAIQGAPQRGGPFLVLVALLAAATNWKQLR